MRTQVASPPPEPVSAPASAGAEPITLEPSPADLGRLNGAWHDLVERIGKMAPLAKNYLLDSKPVEVEATSVTVGFDPEFADNVEKINFPRNLKAIQKVIGNFLDREVTVRFDVLDASTVLPSDTVYEETETADPDSGEPSETPGDGATRTRQEWLKDPVVRKTLDMFNGDIADIRE
jgi:hypothetical protein